MSAVTKLSKSVAHLDKVNSDLSQQMERTQTKFESMANANAELSAKVADLSQKLASKNWQDFQHPKPHSRKTCVLGSSILRGIDPDKLENTDIICMPGGKIPTIHKKLNDIPGEYKRIVLMVGGNDCDSHDAASSERPVSKLLGDYRRLVTDAKKRSADICISTVCPRTKSQHVTERIDALNAELRVLCDEEKCTFVNNDESFKLSNGWANDGYILDGVHLNYAGTNRLVKNLSPAIKKGHQGDICRRKHATKPPHTHQAAARLSQPASNHQTYRVYQPSQGDMLPATQNRIQHPLTTQKHRHHEQRRAESLEQVDGPQYTYNDSGDREMPLYHHGKPHRKNTDFTMGQYHGNEQSSGCDFCSEPNHSKDRCRHGQPITCQTCGERGHKSKHHHQC